MSHHVRVKCREIKLFGATYRYNDIVSVTGEQYSKITNFIEDRQIVDHNRPQHKKIAFPQREPSQTVDLSRLETSLSLIEKHLLTIVVQNEKILEKISEGFLVSMGATAPSLVNNEVPLARKQREPFMPSIPDMKVASHVVVSSEVSESFAVDEAARELANFNKIKDNIKGGNRCQK